MQEDKKRIPTLEDDDPMPFGQYKGKKMENVPAKYLLWLWEEKCSNQLVDNYIWNNLVVLLDEHKDHVLVRRS